MSRTHDFGLYYLLNDVGTELLLGEHDHFALELHTKRTSEVGDIEIHWLS